MNKPKITLLIEKENSGYLGKWYFHSNFFNVYADTIDSLKVAVIEHINVVFENEKFKYQIQDLLITFNLKSFLETLETIDFNALARRLRIQPILLQKFLTGEKEPTDIQAKKILYEIKQIGIEYTKLI